MPEWKQDGDYEYCLSDGIRALVLPERGHFRAWAETEQGLHLRATAGPVMVADLAEAREEALRMARLLAEWLHGRQAPDAEAPVAQPTPPDVQAEALARLLLDVLSAAREHFQLPIRDRELALQILENTIRSLPAPPAKPSP